jgi:hypothetical protein
MAIWAYWFPPIKNPGQARRASLRHLLVMETGLTACGVKPGEDRRVKEAEFAEIHANIGGTCWKCYVVARNEHDLKGGA